ncbi:putative RNA recognition motif domain, nucleotide-binding alpha-beta plait domain superfamily [Helianthus anomalus]
MECKDGTPENYSGPYSTRILKIFVTNLPEGCSGNDLAFHVHPFGQIFDLYIARKRDKGGNCFGFISLLDVKDKDELLRNLRSIRMGDYKLWFNVARFVLEECEIDSHRDQRPTMFEPGKDAPGIIDGKKDSKVGSSEVGARSFKEMLVGLSIMVDNEGLGLGSLHGLAAVVRMVDFSALKNIKVIMKDLSFKADHIQYIGGLNLLITFCDYDSVVKFKDEASLVLDKFVSIAIWKGQVLGFERLAWLKVQGIPLHVLSNEVIDSIGGLFERVVHKDTRSKFDVDLSYEYAGVLVGDGKHVDEEITLNWKDRKFRVWVTEDNEELVPEFLEPSDLGNSNGMEDVDDDDLGNLSPEQVNVDENVEINEMIDQILPETDE